MNEFGAVGLIFFTVFAAVVFAGAGAYLVMLAGDAIRRRRKHKRRQRKVRRK